MPVIRCCTTLGIYEKRLPVTDDIVTRLRDYLAIVDHAFVLNELSDAADEIERLRKLTSELAQLMMPFAMLMTSEEQEKVMKVVRGG